MLVYSLSKCSAYVGSCNNGSPKHLDLNPYLQLSEPTLVHLLEEKTGKVFLTHNIFYLLVEDNPVIGIYTFECYIGDRSLFLGPAKYLNNMTWMTSDQIHVYIDCIYSWPEHSHEITTFFVQALKIYVGLQVGLDNCHQTMLSIIMVVDNISDHTEEVDHIMFQSYFHPCQLGGEMYLEFSRAILRYELIRMWLVFFPAALFQWPR